MSAKIRQAGLWRAWHSGAVRRAEIWLLGLRDTENGRLRNRMAGSAFLRDGRGGHVDRGGSFLQAGTEDRVAALRWC